MQQNFLAALHRKKITAAENFFLARHLRPARRPPIDIAAERAIIRSMITRLGIGLVTRNRRDIVINTINRVLDHTLHPVALVVADDGSQDGTDAMLRDLRHTVIGGPHMGIAWNKNRALFYLIEIARCDIVILLEDDTFPTHDGWEREWIVGAAKFGHVGIAASVPADFILGGAGTPEDPFRATDTSAHCTAFSREAIMFGGYFEPRFNQGGFENVEHSVRLIQHGYGGELVAQAGGLHPQFLLLAGNLNVSHPASQVSPHALNHNRDIASTLIGDPGYRRPWRDAAGMTQFRAEIATAFPRINAQLAWRQREYEAALRSGLAGAEPA